MFSRVFNLLVVVGTVGLSAAGVTVAADEARIGFLGVIPGEVTSEIAAEYGVRAGGGVLVAGVSGGSPASEIGLRENDIIISVNNSGITGPEEFRAAISKMKAGDKVNLVYVRGGKQKSATAELVSRNDREFGYWGSEDTRGRSMRERAEHPRPPRAHRPPRAPREARPPRAGSVAFAGIVAQDLSEGLRRYFRVDRGALVAEVIEGSPAADAGLRAGDVIIRIGDDTVSDERDVRNAIRDRKKGDRVDFTVVREGVEQVFTVTLGEQETRGLGNLDFDFRIPDLSGLNELRAFMPSEEQMRELESKLKDMQLKLEDMEPLDIHIEQLPDNPRIHIERYRIGPVRNDAQGWLRSWQMVKNRFRREFIQLKEDFARLRSEFIELGHDLMGRTA